MEIAAEWSAVIFMGVVALVMIAIIIVCTILFIKGAKEQKRYNNTALPSLQLEEETLNEDGEEYDDEESVFDTQSGLEDDFDDEGFESDKWFAETHGIDEEDLIDIQKRRKKERRNHAVEETLIDSASKPSRRGRSASLPDL